MGAHQLLLGKFIEGIGQALGNAPTVDEQQRAVVAANELQQPRIKGRPAAAGTAGQQGRWMLRSARSILRRGL